MGFDFFLFKKRIANDDDLEWSDYDLCFPVADLYEVNNKTITNRDD